MPSIAEIATWRREPFSLPFTQAVFLRMGWFFPQRSILTQRERWNLADVRLTAPISHGYANIMIFFSLPLLCSCTEPACVGNKLWEVILYGEMHYLCCRLKHSAPLAVDRYSVCSSHGSKSWNDPKHFIREFSVLSCGILQAPCLYEPAKLFQDTCFDRCYNAHLLLRAALSYETWHRYPIYAIVIEH